MLTEAAISKPEGFIPVSWASILARITVAISGDTEVKRMQKFSLLWDLSNAERIHEAMVRISDLENEADALHNTVIADLFKRKDLDPIEILKWKDVYQGLEDACDECKEYTHVIGNIVTKNA